jgi:hypothetical protein
MAIKAEDGMKGEMISNKNSLDNSKYFFIMYFSSLKFWPVVPRHPLLVPGLK